MDNNVDQPTIFNINLMISRKATVIKPVLIENGERYNRYHNLIN
jgi:hypothetical protein